MANHHLDPTIFSAIMLITVFPILPSTALEATAYTCCRLQNTFEGSGCNTAFPSSEFDLEFHQAVWNVPQEYRNETTKNFQLIFLERNESKSCPSVKLISYSSIFPNGLQSNGSESEDVGKPRFSEDGSLLYNGNRYQSNDYCFDSLRTHDGISFDIEVFQSGCAKQKAFPSVHQHEKWIREVFAAVAGLSCLFAVFNVIIYLSLRNYLNVSGWIEFAYFVALAFFSALSMPGLLYEPEESDTFCYVLSVSHQFFVVATYISFFTIAFDIYWMLSRLIIINSFDFPLLLPSNHRKSHAFASYGEDIDVESKLRLVVYYLLIVSVPIGVITYGVVLKEESIPEDLRIEYIPMYGYKSCLTPDWLLTEYVLFGLQSLTFAATLLSVNYIFGRLSVSAEVDDPPRVSLLANLFFFTLSYFIMDLLKFARPLFGIGRNWRQHSSATFWIVLEGFFYAQGILVFIIFIFNRKTLRALRKKSGSDGTLREMFRHACCGSRNGIEAPEDSTPMSPLMKSSSMRRSTVRNNNLY
ncbi:putative G-protein coupled receptor Mth-like 11 [Orchesella cincta]|uniref:Putative G-protein coupled receptor Mth-like 11 n=1 Tax=Orchesella cincta TaxID=48709 RepID=A0A1D2N3T8_ORCCI|nr:putative G-protein coupled receptor Mth-like 11 [Orchesella cincta]